MIKGTFINWSVDEYQKNEVFSAGWWRERTKNKSSSNPITPFPDTSSIKNTIFTRDIHCGVNRRREEEEEEGEKRFLPSSKMANPNMRVISLMLHHLSTNNRLKLFNPTPLPSWYSPLSHQASHNVVKSLLDISPLKHQRKLSTIPPNSRKDIGKAVTLLITSHSDLIMEFLSPNGSVTLDESVFNENELSISILLSSENFFRGVLFGTWKDWIFFNSESIILTILLKL